MPKTTAYQSPQQLEDQAILIATEIFNLINQYTNDSGVAKFFLTDEIGRACYGLAGGFSSIIYAPALTPSDVKNSEILSFYYALMTYGFNIYLKEYSLTTNASPYSMPTEKIVIKKTQKKMLTLTSRGKLVSTPLADKIIEILYENIKMQMSMHEMTKKGHRINKKKFYDYAKLSLYWGYNFAKELLISAQPVPTENYPDQNARTLRF